MLPRQSRKKDGRWRIDVRKAERERERGNTRSANQSHAAPDNPATTIPHHCDHLSFLPRSLVSVPPPFALSRSAGALSCLYLSVPRSRSSSSALSSSLYLSLPPSPSVSPLRFLSIPLTATPPAPPGPPRQSSCHHPFSLALSLPYIYLSVPRSPFAFLASLCPPPSHSRRPSAAPRRAVALSLAPPSNRRSTGRFCI